MKSRLTIICFSILTIVTSLTGQQTMKQDDPPALMLLKEPEIHPLESHKADYSWRTDHRHVNFSDFEQQLQEVLDEGIISYDIKGVSAAMSFANGEIWKGVSGISHDTVTIKQETLFCIGSITKNFIAALILDLYEEGSLELDDPLHQWLPAFEHIDSTATIKQLLNHTSGIYNYTAHPLFDTVYDSITHIWRPEEILEHFVREPYFAPGTNWSYSNTNYILLGMIIKEVTGNDVSFELDSRLYDPIGLDAVFLFPEEGYSGNRSHVWVYIGDSLHDWTHLLDTTAFSSLWTAGSLFSNPEQLVKWSKELNQQGILNDTSLALMKTAAPYSGGSYGLGTQIERIGFMKIYGHTGGAGYTSVLFYVPGDSLSLAVCSNTDNFGCLDIWNDLYYTYKDFITNVHPIEYYDKGIVYPNPFSSTLNFDFSQENPGSVVLTIYNQTGKQVTGSITSHISKLSPKFSINTEMLPIGVYYAAIQTDDKLTTVKLIKVN